MAIDLKKQRENFVAMDFEEKRNIVASLLEWVKDGNRLFTDLYSLVTSDVAIEQDFYDIFDSLMIVLYRQEKAAEGVALDRLTAIRDSLELHRQQEAADTIAWKKEAESLLWGML